MSRSAKEVFDECVGMMSDGQTITMHPSASDGAAKGLAHFVAVLAAIRLWEFEQQHGALWGGAGVAATGSPPASVPAPPPDNPVPPGVAG